MTNISKISQELPNLSFEEIFLLQDKISKEAELRSKKLFKEIENTVSSCPHCGSNNFIKWSKYKDTQRFKCKECNSTFLPTTGTSIHWQKKPKVFLSFCVSMFSSNVCSLKAQAEEFGISTSTAFEWRHKALVALRSEAPEFKGATEMDDIWFRYSQKGRKGLKYSRKRGRSSHKGDNDFVSKVLMSKERGGKFDISLIKIGRLDKSSIEQRLSGKFANTSVLFSDKHPSISSFAKSENLKHETFKAKKHGNKNIHVQTVNNLAGSFKTDVNRVLRGVSTKYLQNYANWFGVKEKYKGVKEKVKEIIRDCLSNNKAWDMFMNTELLYKDFILKKSKRTYRCPTARYRKYQNWNLENAKSGAYI